MGESEGILAVLSLLILSSTSAVIAWMLLRRQTQPSGKRLPPGPSAEHGA